MHEAQMHSENAFLTLTYSDEFLKSPRLVYSDFQLFMKRLRKVQDAPIGMFVTGEYGDVTKRPHWHVITFNWYPRDAVYSRPNERGDKIFKSADLERIWGQGRCEVGSVTFESAGYVARYAAKKLEHGRDQDHDFHPISKKSSKHAIGKAWVEKYWPEVVNLGCIVLNGVKMSTPRYYEKWLKEKQPEGWIRYVTVSKDARISAAQDSALREKAEWEEMTNRRLDLGKTFPLTRDQVKAKIQAEKFKLLQQSLKLR